MNFIDIIGKYGKKDVVDISATIKYGEEWLYKTLNRFKKDYYENDYRLILHFYDDLNEYVDSPSVICNSLYRVLYKLDISEFFVILITNSDVKKDLEVSKNLLNDNKREFFNVDIDVDIEYHPNIDVPSIHKTENIEKQNTTCKKLWNHLYINTNGDVLPCCVADYNQPIGNVIESNINDILSSDKLSDIRQQMLDGKKVSACRICYENEKKDIESMRDPIKENIPSVITSFDIRLSNICNLKCRMCTGTYSSRIAKEESDNFGVNYNVVDLKSIKNTHSIFELLKNAEDVYFAGGEPLIMDTHYQILDELLRLKKHDIKIGYNTNFTKLNYKNISVLDYWKKFNNVTIGASLDGMGKHIEYIRNGTIWEEVLENFDRIQPLDVKFKITANINVLNAFNFIDAQKFWIKKGVKDFHISILTNPDYLSIQILPPSIKDKISQCIKDHINFLNDTNNIHLISVWEDIETFMNKKDMSFLLPNFFNEIKKLDEIRGENFNTVFIEYEEIYGGLN